LYDIVH
jgi:hypothetical protein